MDLNELNGKSFTLWLTDESNESAVYGRWVARAHPVAQGLCLRSQAVHAPSLVRFVVLSEVIASQREAIT